MSPDQVATELIRAWRGKRSQAALSRRLGFRSNVVFDWESGRRRPTAAKAFQLARAIGVDVEGAIERFTRRKGPGRLDTKAGVRALLNDLRGNTTVVELARRSGFSRYAISRLLKGQAEPSLADLLRLIDATTLRLIDFIATVADPAAIPSLQADWRRMSRARELAYEAPWSRAVLRALELRAYQDLPQHAAGFVAERLGIAIEEEERCLQLLAETRQVAFEDGHWVPLEASVVDTRFDPRRSRALRVHWAAVAVERIGAGVEGDFAFNLFGVSSKDLERLRTLQRAYFAELRSIVARSEPVEHVVLTNLHLFALDQ